MKIFIVAAAAWAAGALLGYFVARLAYKQAPAEASADVAAGTEAA